MKEKLDEAIQKKIEVTKNANTIEKIHKEEL